MDKIDAINKLNEARFKAVPYGERSIFMPQCLRHPDCRAKTTDEGIKCLGCGKCNIAEFKKEAEDMGYSVFIVPGSSLAKKLVKKHRPKAILGVACLDELNEAKNIITETGIIAQWLPLLRDGCVNTDVDWKKLREMIR